MSKPVLWTKFVHGAGFFCFSTLNKEKAMLVLTRKLGEKVIIGDNIVVTIVRLSDNKVRLGFEAPKEINVARSELLNAPHRDPL